MRKVDLVGRRFERLLVLKESFTSKHGCIYWDCVCDCGKEKTINGDNIKSGQTKSCGCLSIEMTIERSTIHGHAKRNRHEPEFDAWQAMIERCYNNKNTAVYKNYGGRGIKVCERWLHSFENFFEDMGKRPSDKHSLDRHPNNDGDYEPINCRWATQKEQTSNTRRNRWIEYNGERHILQEWANILGVDRRQINAMMRIKSFNEVYNYYINKKNKVNECV